MKSPQTPKGFTLLEILIVLVVLAVLAALIIPRLRGMKDNAKLTQATREVQTIRAALESYRTFNSPSHLFPVHTTPITNLQASLLVNVTPNVISSGNILYDPFVEPSTEYKYMSSSSGVYYVVFSVGADGDIQPTSVTNTGDITY